MSEQGPFGRRPDAPREPAPALEPAPEPLRPGPPRPPARASTYTWLIGVICILALAYITLNTVNTDAPGSRGIEAGKPLPPFSMVLAGSRRTCGDGRPCDANIARRAGSGAEGRRPACELRAPDLLNSCELAERGPVALAFVATRSDRCEEQVDVMEEVRARHPTVQFAAVSVRGDVDRLRRTIRERGWTIPIGYDHDGAVANLYAVGICPTITFARRGGQVESTSLSFLDAPALERRLRAIGG